MPVSLGAVGISVANMKRSLHFYCDILPLGLTATQTFDVAAFKETVLSLPTTTTASGKRVASATLILMQYKKAPRPKKQQGKLVFYVDDVEYCMKRCKRFGAPVYLELGEAKEDWAKEIGMVRDPDGFLVEFIPAASLKSSENWGDKAKQARL